MIPILLSFNQNGHDSELNFANQDLAKYNTLLAAIKTAVPALTLDLPGFTSLLNNPQQYAFEYIVGGATLVVGGITYNQEQAMPMVITPAWQTVINLVTAFNTDFQTNTVYTYQNQSGNKIQINRLPLAIL